MTETRRPPQQMDGALPHPRADRCVDHDEYGWKLIERTRAGDIEAFGVFYDRHFSNVYGYVFSLVRNRQTAEDLTADTFFRALRAVATVRPYLNSPRGWLISIARNAVRDHHRSCEVRRTSPTDQPPDTPDPQPGPHELVAGGLDAAMVRSLIARLDGDQRRCLELRYLHGRTPAEIATELGRTRLAVAALHHRALTRLRALLAADPPPHGGTR